jgi:LPS-assembly lipoprotein
MRFARRGGGPVFVAMALCLVLAGCGFRPLYGGGKLAPQLAAIYVEPVAERDGYELRNQLIDLLGSDGREAGKIYRLKLTISQVSNGVTLQNDATITRYNDTVTATYVLTDARGTEMTRGSQTSLASFNVSRSPYSSLVVQQDADRRAADDLAERIRIDLGAYFGGRR